MPPGQVMIDYGAMLIAGDTAWAQGMVIGLNVVWGALFVLAVRWLMSQIQAPRTVGLAVVWLAALYPPFVLSTASFGVLSITLLLSTLLLLFGHKLFVAITDHSSNWKAPALYLGAIAGLLSFFRSEAYVIFGFLLLLGLWQARGNLRNAVAPLALSLVAMLLVVSPWMIRNAVTFDRFIPSSTNGSFNFWRGFSDEATGSNTQANGDPVWIDMPDYEAIVGAGLDAGVEDRFADYTAVESKQWISEHPAEAALLTAKKAFLFWIWDYYNDDLRGTLYSILHLCVVLLALVGAVRATRKWQQLDPRFRNGLVLFAAYSAVYTLIAMAFFTMPRLQIFLDASCLTLSSYGAVSLFGERMKAKQSQRLRGIEHIF